VNALDHARTLSPHGPASLTRFGRLAGGASGRLRGVPALYGLQVRFSVQPGRGDELEAILLQAAAGLADVAACRLYVVSRPVEEPDVVEVLEAWTDRETHDASLDDEAARALIGRAMPLLAGRPEAVELRPAGGKGL
jgi:quinol monooxygenase YgiN